MFSPTSRINVASTRRIQIGEVQLLHCNIGNVSNACQTVMIAVVLAVMLFVILMDLIN